MEGGFKHFIRDIAIDTKNYLRKIISTGTFKNSQVKLDINNSVIVITNEFVNVEPKVWLIF